MGLHGNQTHTRSVLHPTQLTQSSLPTMSASAPAAAPATIICGVTCACADSQKEAARGGPKSGVDCLAHDSCEYAKNGQCQCENGVCRSSQNEQKCALATSGQCDCAAGSCKKMGEIRAKCDANPGCACAAGECKKASLPIS